MPRFSCSITRTSGKRSRTSSSVPSVEPWSTMIVSCPRTESSERSTQGSALKVTTTTETSSAIGDRGGRAAEALPEDDREAGRREDERHHEEEEAGRERGVGVNVQLAEEADEEGLAHGEAVDRERHEHDEEQQRAEDDVRANREVDADRFRGGPDRDDPRDLLGCRHERDHEQRPHVVAVAVDAFVGGADRPLDACPLKERHGEPEHAAYAAREEHDARGDRQHDEQSLDP